MLDQLAAKWLEAAFDGVCTLPNIGRLRATGTSFNQAFTSNPVCCPARATIATGLTSRGHGVIENGYMLSPELPTFMRALQEAGWRTGAFGKVHLRSHYESLYPDYRPYGFDLYHGTEDSRGGEWLDWIEDEFPCEYENVLATVWAWDIPGFSEYGQGHRDLASRIRKIRETRDWSHPDFPQNSRRAHVLPFPEELSQTSWITGHATEFIDSVPSDRPLYAHISYVQPHSPFSAPERLMSRVNMARMPPPVPAEWRDDPDGPRELRKSSDRTDEGWQHARHCYFADMVHLDEQLGRIFESLDRTGRLDNTYILFLSDHGELLYDHCLLGKEEKHYDACIRIPLVIRGPGLEQGLVCDDPVQLEDICPTVLDMANVSLPPMPRVSEYPKETPLVLPGHSLLPACRGEVDQHRRDAAYCESYNFVAESHLGQWARTIRTSQFRYTYYPDGYGEQLFDMLSDPGEQNNLVGRQEYAETRNDLRSRLMELIIRQDYPKTRRELYSFGVH